MNQLVAFRSADASPARRCCRPRKRDEVSLDEVERISI
jgi:hypothetical protein